MLGGRGAEDSCRLRRRDAVADLRRAGAGDQLRRRAAPLPSLFSLYPPRCSALPRRPSHLNPSRGPCASLPLGLLALVLQSIRKNELSGLQSSAAFPGLLESG